MAWQWIQKPINKGIFIGVIILFIAALITLIVGITTHTEDNWLLACWDEDEVFLVEEFRTPFCSAPVEIERDRSELPLSVSVRDADGVLLLPGSSGYRAVETAVRAVNLQWGFNFYRMGNDPGVTITLGTGAIYQHPEALGYCRFIGRNQQVREVEIGITNISSIRLLHRVLLHELGHAAGLSHDGFTSSIMYPITIDDTELELQYDRFTNSDVRAIRERYDE